LQLHLGRGQKLHLHSHRGLPVFEVDVSYQLEVLIALLISASMEQKLQKFRIAAGSELLGVSRQVHVDAANVFRLRVRKKQIRNPATHDNDGIAERRQDLADIN